VCKSLDHRRWGGILTSVVIFTVKKNLLVAGRVSGGGPHDLTDWSAYKTVSRLSFIFHSLMITQVPDIEIQTTHNSLAKKKETQF
jgi:hypothetical protein